MENSSSWKHAFNSTGLTSFCLRTDMLMKDEPAVSVTFLKTNVNIHVDFLTKHGSFEMKNITLLKNVLLNLNENDWFEVEACVCLPNSDSLHVCKEPILKQNSAFRMCILPSSGLRVTQILDVQFDQIRSQDYALTCRVVGSGESKKLTSIIEDETIGIVETRLTSPFFEDPSQ